MENQKKILIKKTYESYYTSDISSGEKTNQKNIFLKNYGNLNCELEKNFLQVEIYEKKDKLGIKFFSLRKTRKFGRRYFKTEKVSNFISYNFRTKNFYWGYNSGSKKRIKTKNLIVNSFYRHPYSSFSSLLISDFKRLHLDFLYSEDKNYLLKISEKTYEIEKILNQYCDLVKNKVTDKKLSNIQSHDALLFTCFLIDNEIKYPDSVENFASQRFIKKDLYKDKNIVTYFMSEYNLKGKKIRKILNEFDGSFYNLENVLLLYKVFGVDYFNKIDIRYLQKNISPLRHNINSFLFERDNSHLEDFTNIEKSKMLNLFNLGVSIHDLVEHIKLIKEINLRGHQFKFRSLNPIQFNEEHELVSQIFSDMKKYTVERFYDDNFLRFVQKSIKTSSDDYYPKVLLTTEEYEEESTVQRNCVRTYTTNPTMIISVRKNNKKSDHRYTLEYRFEEGIIKRIQSRKKFNETLNEYEETLCSYLDKKINKFINKNDIDLPSILVKNEYFSKKVKSEINLLTNYLFWKEDLSIFDNNYSDPYRFIDEDLPF